ncbi:MAG: ATP-dependent helicase, partial [Planctomycetota bacterium]
ELRTIEILIGQKIPLAKDQPQPERHPDKPLVEVSNRKDAGVRRPAANVASPRPRRPAKRRLTGAAAGEDKLNQQKRKNSKWRHLKKAAKQTS